MRKEDLFTVGDLKMIIDGLEDSTPVLMVNPVGRGSNECVGMSFYIANDVIIDSEGIAYTKECTHVNAVSKTKGLLIYEG